MSAREDAFRAAWQKADDEGRVGERVRDGLAAADAISGEFTDDQARRIAALTIAQAMYPNAQLHQHREMAEWILLGPDET